MFSKLCSSLLLEKRKIFRLHINTIEKSDFRLFDLKLLFFKIVSVPKFQLWKLKQSNCNMYNAINLNTWILDYHSVSMRHIYIYTMPCTVVKQKINSSNDITFNITFCKCTSRQTQYTWNIYFCMLSKKPLKKSLYQIKSLLSNLFQSLLNYLLFELVIIKRNNILMPFFVGHEVGKFQVWIDAKHFPGAPKKYVRLHATIFLNYY